jgi:very-short-patch-repair endonuclease
VEVVDALAAFGGAARRRQLSGVPRRALQRAVADGSVVRQGKVYALPEAGHGVTAARLLHGTATHRSAARHHGFALPPGEDEDVTIPAGARRTAVPDGVRLRRGVLPSAVMALGVSDALLTVVQCLRDCSLRVALSVGDSALRSGKVTYAELEEATAGLRGPGSALARRRLRLLDAKAENAFESCCRAALLEAGITAFRPQVVIRDHDGFVGRVDLADTARRIVVECDGFVAHGSREAMVADCVRHTRLVAAGWRPLRFTWEQVMFRSWWVIDRVRDVIELAQRPRKTTKRPRQARKGAESAVA